MHEAVDLGEAEAGPLPSGLGREEWFEDPGRDLGGEAWPAVAHLHPCLVALGFDGDRDLAAFWHGVPRIGAEVDQRRLQLQRVEFHPRILFGRMQAQADREAGHLLHRQPQRGNRFVGSTMRVSVGPPRANVSNWRTNFAPRSVANRMDASGRCAAS